MKDVFARLGADFLSTIVFLVIYLSTDNVLLATSWRSPARSRQVIYARVKGKPLGYMTYASLALVDRARQRTLLTHDPRFVLAKPAIGHFAIGAIMLKRGWMLRYMPPIVAETIPEYVTVAGYAWAALMFVLGAGTIAVALDRRPEAVVVLRLGRAGRRQDPRLRRAVCRVSASSSAAGSAPPPAPNSRDTRRLGLRGEMGYTAGKLGDPRTIRLLGSVGETEMAVDGNWNITMTTPMGERKATLNVKSAGGTLTGTQGADGNSGEIFDGTVNGDDVAWKISITNPMPLTLEFTGKVSGDSMSGEMGIGPMGSFPFTGKRA